MLLLCEQAGWVSSCAWRPFKLRKWNYLWHWVTILDVFLSSYSRRQWRHLWLVFCHFPYLKCGAQTSSNGLKDMGVIYFSGKTEFLVPGFGLHWHYALRMQCSGAEETLKCGTLWVLRMGWGGKAECFLCGSILIHRWETWNPFALSCVETAWVLCCTATCLLLCCEREGFFLLMKWVATDVGSTCRRQPIKVFYLGCSCSCAFVLTLWALV